MNFGDFMNDLLDKLKKYRERDWSYDSGRIFSSMCTNPLDEALEAHQMYTDVNALDSKIFPSAKRLESEVIRKISALYSSTHAGGYITSGGTEGNIYALWLARKLRDKGEKVIAPISAHYSMQKACDLQQLKLIQTTLNDQYKAEVEDINEQTDKETIAIVATVGTTALGKIDPIREIAEIAEDAGCFLHVDASFGGFVLPFIKNAPPWDFEIESVSSITSDPHKMGLTPIPSGVLLVRNHSWIDELRMDIPYLDQTSATLLGTRPGASIASTWMALNLLDSNNYGRIVRRCMKLTRQLAEGIRGISDLRLVTEPELNLVSFTSNTSDVSQLRVALERRRWLVSLNSQPESVRLVVMPHHREEHIRSFLNDLRECVRELS